MKHRCRGGTTACAEDFDRHYAAVLDTCARDEAAQITCGSCGCPHITLGYVDATLYLTCSSCAMCVAHVRVGRAGIAPRAEETAEGTVH